MSAAEATPHSVRGWAASVFEKAGGTAALRALADHYALRRGGIFPRLRHRASRPFQILMYHRIQEASRPFSIDTLPIDRFEEHIRHLSRRYRVLPLTELVRQARERSLPPRSVAITFDDGYRDNFTHAWPILRRFGVPATIFLATGFIGSGSALWHDQVLHAFAHSRRDRYPDPWTDETVTLHGAQEGERAAHAVLARLKRLPGSQRELEIARLFETLRVDRREVSSDLMLEWGEVRTMASSGIEFGSHTVNHPILSLESRDVVAFELAESKRTLERELDREATLFAYPNGGVADYTPETIRLVRAAGYDCALTTRFGTNEAGDDPYEWKRGTPWEEERSVFSLKLALYRALES